MSIGYACLTIGVPHTDLSRCTLKNATEDKLRKITESNLTALETMIDYNIDHGIKLFRISSDLIPFGSHSINQIRWWDEYRDTLYDIGKKITRSGMRVSMHPGQYTVLNSSDPRIVQNAIKDLTYHEKFLTSLGMDEKSKLILHIGGVYGDKKNAMKVFIDNYHRLPDEIKARLIIENDDRNYNVEEVWSIYQETGAPIVFDNLHHKINPPDLNVEMKTDFHWIEKCAKTWSDRDGRQKIHYSEQQEGKSKGSHSDTINITTFREYYDKLHNQNIDIMLEVKDKNLSAIKCMSVIDKKAAVENMEEEIKRYQYFILSRSDNLYQEFLQISKSEDSDRVKEFYLMTQQALTLPEDEEAEVKAARCIWNNLIADCTQAERNRFEKLINAYRNHSGTILPVKNHLLKCAKSQNMFELVQSLYFYL